MKPIIKAPAIAGAFSIILIATAGCSRRVYVPVERYVLRSDSVRSVALRIDSLVVRDSIHIAEKGDTVFRDHYRWRYRDRIVHDTVRLAASDRLLIREQPSDPLPAKTSPAGKALLWVKSRILQPLGLLTLTVVLGLLLGRAAKRRLRRMSKT